MRGGAGGVRVTVWQHRAGLGLLQGGGGGGGALIPGLSCFTLSYTEEKVLLGTERLRASRRGLYNLLREH